MHRTSASSSSDRTHTSAASVNPAYRPSRRRSPTRSSRQPGYGSEIFRSRIRISRAAPALPYSRSRRLLLCRSLLLSPGAFEDELEPGVAFVARVLVDEIVGVPERNHQGPRPRPRLRIRERHLVVHGFRADPGETLGQLQVLRRASETGFQI